MAIIFFVGLSVGFWPEVRTEAAGLTNVMKAPVAKAGKWSKNRKGLRYKYVKNSKYAKNVWQKINGQIYFFEKNGYAHTGWKTYHGKRYYLNRKGQLVTGWQKLGGGMYYFQKTTGYAVTGKKKIGKDTYYFSTKGVRQTGWRKIKGQYYYFYPSDGTMAKNTIVGKYSVDAKGIRRKKMVWKPVGKNGRVDFFVGDSRTVLMGRALGISDICIAKSGAAIDWYVEVGEPELRKKLAMNPKATVVINMGVNDVLDYDQYIAKYARLLNDYPDAGIYIMSVNPVESWSRGEAWAQKRTKGLKKFNERVKAAFGNRYLDCCGYLNKTGFATVDSLHYDDATYLKIYQYALKHV